MRLHGLALMALFAFSGASLPAYAADPAKPVPKPFSRDDARAIVAQSRRIVSPQGIEETRQVEIGGIRQWISVRGNDRRNPILLYVHGGPGAAEMVESYGYQRPWEDFFTVVQWDQRGAGKTYAAIPGAAWSARKSRDAIRIGCMPTLEPARSPTCARASRSVTSGHWNRRGPRATGRPCVNWKRWRHTLVPLARSRSSALAPSGRG